METKEYYEINLPGYLQHDLDAMKEGKWPYDCLWGELYGSINCAFIDGDITEDHAWYLREKYLDMERVRSSVISPDRKSTRLNSSHN